MYSKIILLLEVTIVQRLGFEPSKLAIRVRFPVVTYTFYFSLLSNISINDKIQILNIVTNAIIIFNFIITLIILLAKILMLVLLK